MYVLGSIFSMLVFQVLGGSPQASMEQVWSDVVDDYTQHKVEAQFTNLELGNFHHAGNVPKLSGKGAGVKGCSSALHHVWQEHDNPSLRHHMIDGDMLHNQCKVQDLLAHHKGKVVLPDVDAMLLTQHVDNVLVKYSLLANWADKEGNLLFNVAPTHHYLWHMGQQATYLNPRKPNTKCWMRLSWE